MQQDDLVNFYQCMAWNSSKFNSSKFNSSKFNSSQIQFLAIQFNSSQFNSIPRNSIQFLAILTCPLNQFPSARGLLMKIVKTVMTMPGSASTQVTTMVRNT